MQKQSRAGNIGGRSPRNNSPHTNVNSNSVRYSLQDNTITIQKSQRFVPQQQKKLLSQAQQKQNIPQSQYMQQHQQLLQQQAAMRQQEQQMHQPQTQEQQLPPIHQPQYVQPNYIIRPPSQHLQHPHCPLPPYVDANQIQQTIENTPVSEEYPDSTRMLVLQENGDQRLITLCLPIEGCTIQNILQAASIPFHPDNKIECTKTSHAGIDYLVSIGTQNHENSSLEDMVDSGDNSSQNISQRTDVSTVFSEAVTPKAPTPVPITEVEVEIPHNVPGVLVICNYCGYTSENINRSFLRCKYKFPKYVKTRPALNSCTNGKKPDVFKFLQANQNKKTSPTKGSNCPTGKVTVVFSSDEEEKS